MFDLTPPAPPLAPLRIDPPHICDAPSFDLDGDGVSERYETVPDTRGTGGAVYAVYVGERRVGEIAGCWFRLGQKRRHGLRDIVGIWRGGACLFTPRTYRFDGRRYRAGAAVEKNSCERQP